MDNGSEIGQVIAAAEGRCEWSIPGFRTLPRERVIFFKSPDFEAVGSSWWLIVSPNGMVGNPRIFMQLHRRDWEKKNFICTLGLRRADGSHERIDTKTCPAHDLLSCDYLSDRTREELESGEWLSGGKLTVTCHVREVDEQNALQDDMFVSSESASEDSGNATETKNIDETNPIQDASTSSEAKGVARLVNNVEELLSPDNEDYDVTILVKGQEFRAHKCLLKTRSPVFRMILTHDSKEKNSNEIPIEDCDPDCFDEFLLFVYSGHTGNLTTSKALHLYYAADKYDFPDLKEQCVVHLEASLSVASVCYIVHLAAKHGEIELLRTATDFFAKNVKQILLTVEWQNFMAENPTVANELYIKSLEKLGH